MSRDLAPAAVVADPALAAEITQPLLSVVKGEPSAEELAALAAVVLSLGGADAAQSDKPTVRHWVRRQQLRLAPSPGPGAWKRSRG